MRDIGVTLFSGIGSSSKALRDLGLEVKAHDFAPAAVATLQANGFDAIEANVKDLDYASERFAGNVRVVAGGPPCQPFSQAHEGEGRYDDRDMIPEFLRAIAALLPELFVMEEVQTLTWKQHIDYLLMVEDHMRALGYRVEHKILNAAHYGHGQARKRLFVVGVREDIAEAREASNPLPHGGWTVPTDAIRWLDASLYPEVTMAQRLGWDARECMIRNQQVPDARAHVAAAADSIALWPLRRASTTVVGSFRPEVQAAPGYRKAGDPPRQATPGSVVTTFAERLRLQDLPADWVVCGKPSDRDLQVGNSVPCGLMRDLVAANLDPR